MQTEPLSFKFHALNPKLSSHTAILRPCGFYFLFKSEDAVCVEKLWICFSSLNDKNVEPMLTLYVYFVRRTTQCEWILLFTVKNIHRFQVGKYVIYLKVGKKTLNKVRCDLLLFPLNIFSQYLFLILLFNCFFYSILWYTLKHMMFFMFPKMSICII